MDASLTWIPASCREAMNVKHGQLLACRCLSQVMHKTRQLVHQRVGTPLDGAAALARFDMHVHPKREDTVLSLLLMIILLCSISCLLSILLITNMFIYVIYGRPLASIERQLKELNPCGEVEFYLDGDMAPAPYEIRSARLSCLPLQGSH